jgi:hypothetical protein
VPENDLVPEVDQLALLGLYSRKKLLLFSFGPRFQGGPLVGREFVHLVVDVERGFG